MTSQKKQRANQQNAQYSTGPKTEEGRRRSAINSRKHGLSIKVDNTDWGDKIQKVINSLKQDGYDQELATTLARQIVDFERNIAFQKEEFLRQYIQEASELEVNQEAEEYQTLATYLERSLEPENPDKTNFGPKLSQEITHFFKLLANKSERKAKSAKRVQKIHLDRYYRRSANQLIKQLKGL